jgi:two-component system, OmpR family, response regulator VanR
MTKNRLSYLKHLTLMLVEDDEELLETLNITFSLFFKNIITAKNGVEALKIYEKTPVDMIITDYVMPYMNGYEFCTEIRKVNKNIPMVIISNYTEREKLLKAIPLQLTDYLIKPIEYTILTNTLLSMLEKIEEYNLIKEPLSDSISFNIITKELIVDSEVVALTKGEISLLTILLKHKNNIVTDEMIMFAFDALETKSTQSIKNYIYRLRKKIGTDIILNIKGVGYILKPLVE